jgi:Protein of unknown function (DUF2442)
MAKVHIVQSIHTDDTYLYLTVDGQAYRVRWADCSARLVKATSSQRKRLEVSPSGYGIHWPEVDEDLAITPLLKNADIVTGHEQRERSTLPIGA